MVEGKGVLESLAGQYTTLGYVIVGLIAFHVILVIFLIYAGFRDAATDKKLD
jgi:high-affinity Fe2+/Pb2+ permease